jgi:PAS domain-containing protein
MARKLTYEELEQRDFFLSANSSLKEHLPEIRPAVLEQQSVWEGEVSDIDANVTRIWRKTRLFPIKDEGCASSKIAYVSEDITERKQAEETLLKSKELFEKTFISQHDAIFILDTNIPPKIINCNPSAMEVFGYQ